MPHGDDGDRPRKSWKEIDSQRDKSSHRREDRERNRGPSESSQAYRSYKTQLHKVFDGGGLPDALKEKLGSTAVGEEAKRRKQAVKAILDAGSPKAVLAAVESYRKAHGFPENEEVLAKLLDLSDEDIVLEAVQTCARLHEEGGLKRAASLEARLKTVQMTIDEPEVMRAAKELLGKLRR